VANGKSNKSLSLQIHIKRYALPLDMQRQDHMKTEDTSLEEAILQGMELEEDVVLQSQNLSKKVETVPKKPYKYTWGDGWWEGIFLAYDPLGLVAKVIGQRMGYDIQTLGGLCTIKEENEDPDSLRGFGRGIGGVMALSTWTNPLAWPVCFALQAGATVINISSYLYRRSRYGSLKKPLNTPYKKGLDRALAE